MSHAKRWYLGVAVGVGVGALLVSAPEPAGASMKMQKAAKKAGFEVKNCLYCHNEKLPKKDKATNNHRGQWLVDQMKEREAEEIDVAWLEDYVEPEKEKK